MLQALLIAIYAWWLGSPLNLNTSFIAFMRPLVSGLVVGLILGDPVKGVLIGAAINAVYIGYMSVGGAHTGDILIAGVLGTALGILANMNVETALAFAIPVGMLGNSVSVLKMSLFSVFTHWADRFAERGNSRGIALLNLVPGSIFAILYPGIPVFLAVQYGVEPVQALLNIMPAKLIAGLAVVGKLLPAVGYALLLRYMCSSREDFPLYLIGFVLAAYLKMDVIGIVILAVCLALVLYFRNGKEVSQNEA
ncbi:MAG TPA: PTS sugar transporter subunit IIC [Firmicutes bacterium]|nr:PTS sugar transporter subunit IIC [Candidatus Fermentithermobacillaceae bacterium]